MKYLLILIGLAVIGVGVADLIQVLDKAQPKPEVMSIASAVANSNWLLCGVIALGLAGAMHGLDRIVYWMKQGPQPR